MLRQTGGWPCGAVSTAYHRNTVSILYRNTTRRIRSITASGRGPSRPLSATAPAGPPPPPVPAPASARWRQRAAVLVWRDGRRSLGLRRCGLGRRGEAVALGLGLLPAARLVLLRGARRGDGARAGPLRAPHSCLRLGGRSREAERRRRLPDRCLVREQSAAKEARASSPASGPKTTAQERRAPRVQAPGRGDAPPPATGS